MMDRRRVLWGMGAGALSVMVPERGYGRLLPVEVRTTCGTVRGHVSSSSIKPDMGVMAFKGIPYGVDTRETRFQAPRKVAAWTGVKVCTEWGARAPQQSSASVVARPDAVQGPLSNRGSGTVMGEEGHYHLPVDEGKQSEDCLHLNVWTGAPDETKKKLPVLFYIHGGAYNNGTVNAAIYDGTRLAERGDCVVVTVNHRLNAFGYLYLGGMDGLGGAYRDSGNVGMLDLVLALEWVRDNIAEFGGDKDRVTIFGQSGGGAKCATLMAMESARGLFHRVWTMSGQQVWGSAGESCGECEGGAGGYGDRGGGDGGGAGGVVDGADSGWGADYGELAAGGGWGGAEAGSVQSGCSGDERGGADGAGEYEGRDHGGDGLADGGADLGGSGGGAGKGACSFQGTVFGGGDCSCV